MKLVSFENLSKYNELLNQKTVRSVNSIKPDSNGNVNISSNSTNIVGVTNNRNLGEIFTSSIPLESSQVHLLDGSALTDATELYDYLESIKDTNPDLFTTDSEFNSEVESTGKCSKFVINTDNKTVRIPKGDSNNYIVIKNYDTKFEFNQPFSLLEPKWSDVPLNNPSWLLSNGQINSSENYPSVYELLLNEYNNGTLKSETIDDVVISYKQLDNGHKVVTDKTAYESILKHTGTAWYYLLDLDSRTFVLPQTDGYMKYGNSNQFIKQSLPNIKGQTGYTVTSGDDETTAPFEKLIVSSYGTVSGQSNPAKFVRIGFDASTYSDIYADDANVNPNAVQGYLYFYVGECVGASNSVNLGDIKDKLDLDVNNIKTELNNLKGNISSIGVEIDSFSYDIVGYIRYKNGLQLCWGGGNGIDIHRTRYTLDTTITFKKPFYDTNYVIVGTGFFIIGYAEQCIADVTTTGFKTRSSANSCATGGYLAIGRWK